MILNKMLDHRKFSESFRLAYSMASQADPGSLLFIVGPSGVGKSTLRARLSSELVAMPSEWPPGHIPILSLNVKNPDRGFFSPKDFATRMVSAIGDPFHGQLSANTLDDQDKSEALIAEMVKENVLKQMRLSMTEANLLRVFQEQARVRSLRFILLDEAQLLCIVQNNRDPGDYLENLKILAIELGIVILLFGTYQLLQIWNYTSQLNRRCFTVHLQRYDKEVATDVDEFRNLLNQMSEPSGEENRKLILDRWSLIYDATLGIVGEVDAFLFRAHQLAKAMNEPVLKIEHLVAAIYTHAQLAKLYNDVALGESVLAKATEFPDMIDVIRKIVDGRQKPRQRGRRRPGLRNPIRDPTGEGE